MSDSFIDRHQDNWTALRRDLHAHPELAFAETRTSDRVAERLALAGLEVRRGLAGTGVVGLLQGRRPGPMIGLRADMDALPLHEANDFAHRSTHAGRMHACGHDGHTAMLVAAAETLADAPDFAGAVAFIFQPAEEGDGGARQMMDEGLFAEFPCEEVYALHNWPGLAAGSFAVHRGPVMASADQFDIVLHGHGAHAAMPHQGLDPVTAAAALIQTLQTVVSRRTDPLKAAVVSVTRMQAGEAYNIIPESVTVGGTVRALDNGVRDALQLQISEAAAGIAAAHGLRATVEYRRGYPATVNHPTQADFARAIAEEVAGRESVRTDLAPSMGAEDFGFMLMDKPGAYLWIGNGPGSGGCMLHNPHYDFNDAILPLGVRFWRALVQRRLPL
ncbi:MAG: amidohydrolase [Betaproteobacteria bacterium]|nr:amidohydrolase [Betaproteobacteria bacterium]NCU84931.1 amidohydrolase [Betaproteobacteria bacterium]NDD12960.1 amidohydrolase [Betaproteobacteria bacterium]